MLVIALNAGSDRGARFFPFLTREDGGRRFVDLEALLATDVLVGLHQQSPRPGFLVDGVLHAKTIDVRAIDAERGVVRRMLTVDYDPVAPWPALRRVAFELAELLGWSGVPSLPALPAEAIGWFLIAKDDLLALEARVEPVDAPRRLRAACELVRLAPDDADANRTLIDVARHLVIQRHGGDAVVRALAEASERSTGPQFLEAAARIVSASDRPAAATSLWLRIASLHPQRTDAVLEASGALVSAGRDDEARAMLRGALVAGNRDLPLRAQLAAIEDAIGEIASRDALLEGMCNEVNALPSPPAPVARLVAMFLTERGRTSESIELLDRALASDGASPGLLLERGRALIAERRGAEARTVLERCRTVGAPAALQAEAERLLQFTVDDRVLSAIQAIEAALARRDNAGALRLAKRFVRRHRRLAEGWLLVGVARQRCGRERGAIRALRRAIDLEPTLAEAHNRVGILLAARGRNWIALEHLLRAVELAPNDASAWLHLAQVHRNLGARSAGLTALARAERVGGYREQLAVVKRLFDLPAP